MIFELIEDTTKLAIIVAGLYFAFGGYVRRKQPAWSEPLEKRRLAILAGQFCCCVALSQPLISKAQRIE